MPRRSSKRALKELSQQEATWHLAIHQLRVWVEAEDENPVRPWAMLLLNMANGMIQHSTLVLEYPKAAEVADFLAEAMRRRDSTLGIKPSRPTLVQVEDAALKSALTMQLANIGVHVAQVKRLEELDNILTDLEASLGDGAEPKGLLSTRGVKPEMVASLFAAAAEFYRQSVWEKFDDEEVLKVEVVESKRARFVIVMGGGGIEYGLAVYEKWSDIELIFETATDPFSDPLDRMPAGGAHALTLSDVTSVPFEDLDAIKQYGWEIADDDAYPVPVIWARGGTVRRPQRPELQWYDAVLRALPIFIRSHWRRDEKRAAIPVEAVIPVTTSAGDVHVRISYPAGVLPERSKPRFDPAALFGDEQAEGDDVFDPRLMDRVFSEIFGGAFGLAVDADVDDEAQQAQQLIYEAWEESRPARRIQLARQALAISPDCADAYVLLAEEAAESAEDALPLCEQAVAAGERVLGPKYFRENAGHFWGLFETRPYMRARQRLAETLWELGRLNEAADHFSDMLRLNPTDNQGVRYQLLNVLLEQEQDAQALKLIRQYPEDTMAAWTFTNLLLVFRQHGPGKKANAALKAALASNAHVPDYLTGKKRVPARVPGFTGFGDPNEAINYAAEFRDLWRRTPGAIEWLKAATKNP